MLPTPVSLPSRRPFRSNGGLHTRQRTVDKLLTRSRVTNLALLILSAVTVLSLLVNVSYYLSSSDGHRSSHPSSIFSTLARDTSLQSLDHLVIVPGHAIWHGMDPSSRLDEDEWVLEPYQKQGGIIEALFQHISRGVEIAKSDRHALLVFSGGQTRTSSTMTESESYLRLALNANLFDATAPSTPFPRATTENYALDSFQNLLFSILRFREFTGRFPNKITVVGYEMKRARFTDLHRVAIRWPKESFHYIGIDPPSEASRLAQEGERQNGYIPYSNDLYGCHSELLAKRRSRNPFTRFHSYFTSSPELTEILEYCPSQGTTLFQGLLPWT